MGPTTQNLAGGLGWGGNKNGLGFFMNSIIAASLDSTYILSKKLQVQQQKPGTFDAWNSEIELRKRCTSILLQTTMSSGKSEILRKKKCLTSVSRLKDTTLPDRKLWFSRREIALSQSNWAETEPATTPPPKARRYHFSGREHTHQFFSVGVLWRLLLLPVEELRHHRRGTQHETAESRHEFLQRATRRERHIRSTTLQAYMTETTRAKKRQLTWKRTLAGLFASNSITCCWLCSAM